MGKPPSHPSIDRAVVPPAKVPARRHGGPDPNDNYLVSYNKEAVGKLIGKTKFLVTMEVMIGGESYLFEMKHSQITGHYSISVNRRIMCEYSAFADTGLRMKFEELINGHAVEVLIDDKKNDTLRNFLNWEYVSEPPP